MPTARLGSACLGLALLIGSLSGCASPVATPRAATIALYAEGAVSAEAESEHTFDFQVPPNALGLRATLAWRADAGALSLALVAPDGGVKAGGAIERDGSIVAQVETPVDEGTWKLRVGGAPEVETRFVLEATARAEPPAQDKLQRLVNVTPRGVEELNLILEPAAEIRVSVRASHEIEWNIHSHAGTAVKHWREGKDTAVNETFLAPERGGYSLFLSNPHLVPAQLRIEITGTFALHASGTREA